MLLTTTPNIQGREITQYFGIVSGETIIGANLFKDFFAGIRDIVGGRASSYESVLREAKESALQEMSDQAARMGANAVIGIDLDYETVGTNGSMLMVTAAGNSCTLSINRKSPYALSSMGKDMRTFFVTKTQLIINDSKSQSK